MVHDLVYLIKFLEGIFKEIGLTGVSAIFVLLIFVVAVILCLNARKILFFLEEIKIKRFNLMKSVSENIADNSVMKKIVELERNKENFRLISGFYLDLNSIDKLWHILEKSGGRLNLEVFKRSRGFWSFERENLIEISRWAEIGYFFNKIAFFVFVSNGFLFLAFPIMYRDISIFQGLTVFGMGFFSIFLGLIFLYQNSSYNSAKRIESEIERQFKENSLPDSDTNG